MKFVNLILVVFWILVCSKVVALPCNTKGLDILKLADGIGLMFFVYNEKSDLVFVIPGETISFPEKKLQSRFYIDKNLFEYTLVNFADFLKDKNATDSEVLKAHTLYEQSYLKSLKTPLIEFVDYGERVKPATDTQPEFYFALWQAKDPKNKTGASQFYLSTVSSGQVFLLSAIALNGKEDQVKSALQYYAGTFHHISAIEQCPKK